MLNTKRFGCISANNRMERNYVSCIFSLGVFLFLHVCHRQVFANVITQNLLVTTPNSIYQTQLNTTTDENQEKLLEASILYTLENKTLVSIYDKDMTSMILHTQDEIFTIEFNKVNITQEMTSLIQLPDIRKIAVDDIHKNLYFYEEYFQIIGIIPYSRYSSDKLFRVILNSVNNLIDMAFAPEEGFLFWITRNNYPVIHRSDSTGKHKRDIVFKGLLFPINIEVNRYSKEIVWLDKRKHTIESANYDGFNRKVIHQTHTEFKGLVAINNNSILTFKSRTVLLIHNTREYSININVEENITDITIQYNGKHKDACEQKECSQFCFKDDSNMVCECYDWNTLHINGKDCLAPTEYVYQGIFIVLNGKICQSKLELITQKTGSFSCWKDISNVTEITADMVSKTLYYIKCSGNSFELSKRILGFSSIEVLYRSSNGLRGLAVDEEHHIIYFGSKNLMKVYNISAETDLLQDESDIVSIAVDSKNGLITWITTTNHLIKIASLDGSNQRTLFVSLAINKLAISSINMRVFWTTCGGIMSVNEDGGDIKVNIVNKDLLEDMYIYKNLMIWTTEIYHNSSKLCSTPLDKDPKIPKCMDVNGDINDISIYDESLKFGVQDVCDTDNNRCEDICLSNTNPICGCRAGRTLKDSFSCKPETLKTMDCVLVDNNGNFVYGFALNSSNMTLLMRADGPVRDIAFHEIDDIIFVIQNHSFTVLSPGNNTSTTKYLPEYYIQMACLDSSTRTMFFIHKSMLNYSLVKYSMETKDVVELYSDISNPNDILCESAKGYVIIAEDRGTLFMRRFSLFKNTTTPLQTLLQNGDFRIAAYPDDDHFYVVTKSSNQIFEFDYEGRSSLLYSSTGRHIIDIDVDRTYIYVLIENDRFILQVKKSDGRFESNIQQSVYFGTLGMITTLKRQLITEVRDLSTEKTSPENVNLKSKESNTNVLQIAIPVVLLTIALVSGVSGGIAIHRRRQRKFTDTLKVWNRREKPVPIPRSQGDINEPDEEYNVSYTSSATLEYNYTEEDGDNTGNIERTVSIRAPHFNED